MKKFTGIWVPKEILELDLTFLEMFLLADILSMNKSYRSNRTFAKRYKKSERQISRAIQNLKKKNLLNSNGKNSRTRTLMSTLTTTSMSSNLDTNVLVTTTPVSNIDKVKRKIDIANESLQTNIPMNRNEFVKWCNKSKQEHIKFIGDWAETVEPTFTTKAQWDVFMKRHMRSATAIVKFDRGTIEKAYTEAMHDSSDGKKFNVTIETLIKYITK
jgi:hypothetical protein